MMSADHNFPSAAARSCPPLGWPYAGLIENSMQSRQSRSMQGCREPGLPALSSHEGLASWEYTVAFAIFLCSPCPIFYYQVIMSVIVGFCGPGTLGRLLTSVFPCNTYKNLVGEVSAFWFAGKGVETTEGFTWFYKGSETVRKAPRTHAV